MSTCSFCGKEYPDDRKYCTACGSNLYTSTGAACQRCGFTIQAGAVFCPRCGARLVHPGSQKLDPKQPPIRLTPSHPSSANGLPDNDPQQPPASVPEKLTEEPSPLKNRAHPRQRTIETSPARTRLIPTHEVIRMANALGIEIDYNTLRFWQKRGLVPKPLRGPVDKGRGTRGYYDACLIDRIAFIRTIQKDYCLGLDAIREELETIDRRLVGSTHGNSVELYQERLVELQAQRDLESKRTMVAMLGKALGIDPEEIATIVVRKRDGQTIRFLPARLPNETD